MHTQQQDLLEIGLEWLHPTHPCRGPIAGLLDPDTGEITANSGIPTQPGGEYFAVLPAANSWSGIPFEAQFQAGAWMLKPDARLALSRHLAR